MFAREQSWSCCTIKCRFFIQVNDSIYAHVNVHMIISSILYKWKKRLNIFLSSYLSIFRKKINTLTRMFLLCTLINIQNVGKNNTGASKLKKGRNHVVSGNRLVTHYEFKRLLVFHFFLKKNLVPHSTGTEPLQVCVYGSDIRFLIQHNIELPTWCWLSALDT